MALLGRKGSYDREPNKTQLVFNFTESAKFQCFLSIYVDDMRMQKIDIFEKQKAAVPE